MNRVTHTHTHSTQLVQPTIETHYWYNVLSIIFHFINNATWKHSRTLWGRNVSIVSICHWHSFRARLVRHSNNIPDREMHPIHLFGQSKLDYLDFLFCEFSFVCWLWFTMQDATWRHAIFKGFWLLREIKTSNKVVLIIRSLYFIVNTVCIACRDTARQVVSLICLLSNILQFYLIFLSVANKIWPLVKQSNRK